MSLPRPGWAEVDPNATWWSDVCEIARLQLLAAKLTGEYLQDHHTASQCDPLYLIRDFEWNDEWTSRILGGLPLPRLVWPADVIGVITDQAFAVRCGRRR